MRGKQFEDCDQFDTLDIRYIVLYVYSLEEAEGFSVDDLYSFHYKDRKTLGSFQTYLPKITPAE